MDRSVRWLEQFFFDRHGFWVGLCMGMEVLDSVDGGMGKGEVFVGISPFYF